MFRKLDRGGDLCLPLIEVMDKLDLLGMGYDRKEIASDLKSLKDFATEKVEHMCRNHLMLDPEAHGIDHLTRARIAKEDLPWYDMGMENGIKIK